MSLLAPAEKLPTDKNAKNSICASFGPSYTTILYFHRCRCRFRACLAVAAPAVWLYEFISGFEARIRARVAAPPLSQQTARP